MKFGGEHRFKAIAGRSNVAAMARGLGVSEDWPVSRAAELAAAIPDALADRIGADGMRDDAAAVRLLDTVSKHIAQSCRW